MSNRVSTISKVRIYEQDDEEVPIGTDAIITVESHWNREDFVVITIDDKEIAVVAKDLVTAIARCSQ